MRISHTVNEWDGKLRLFWAAGVGIAFCALWLLRHALGRLSWRRHGSLTELESLRRSGAI